MKSGRDEIQDFSALKDELLVIISRGTTNRFITHGGAGLLLSYLNNLACSHSAPEDLLAPHEQDWRSSVLKKIHEQAYTCPTPRRVFAVS